MLDIVITVIFILSVAYSIPAAKVGEVSAAAVTSCADAVELTLNLAGNMALWGGFLRVAQKCGFTDIVNKLSGKVLRPLFPGLAPDGAAMKAISMNVTANLLGLGNAATPLGICAVREIVREENAKSTTRNIAMLILLNTASIQLIPVTVAAIRAKYGSVSPWDCTLPIIANSAAALFIGILAVTAVFGRRKANVGISGGAAAADLRNSYACGSKES